MGPKTGSARSRERGGGEGGLRKVKVFVESMPGAVASHVCIMYVCVCVRWSNVRIYKRDGAQNIAAVQRGDGLWLC